MLLYIISAIRFCFGNQTSTNFYSHFHETVGCFFFWDFIQKKKWKSKWERFSYIYISFCRSFFFWFSLIRWWANHKFERKKRISIYIYIRCISIRGRVYEFNIVLRWFRFDLSFSTYYFFFSFFTFCCCLSLSIYLLFSPFSHIINWSRTTPSIVLYFQWSWYSRRLSAN